MEMERFGEIAAERAGRDGLAEVRPAIFFLAGPPVPLPERTERLSTR